ncbi:MAG: glycosyltransferase family 4 protein [Candidatus Magasanikbacteria bacterium]|nr:glycosyltransferase family 4 protein [Candidatus Magasanikbacteria bacterium]
MTIGIDASRANRIQKTGVESYAYFLIQELKKIQTEHEFVLYTDKPLEGELADLPTNWIQKVLRWPAFAKATAGKPWRFWTQIRMSWEMLFHAPDVLFIPAHVFPIIHPKKTIMTIHDVAALKFPESYNWFERWYSTWSARVALKKLWRIITPSEFTKAELGSWKLEARSEKLAKKISVISLAYDLKYRKMENKTEIEKVLKKYNIIKPFILTIGRLEEKKNTVRIIQAFEKIRQNNLKSFLPKADEILSLVLVGKPGYGYEKVETAIQNSPFKKDIITPGWVDEADLPYLMNSAEVFVFPSLYEGFGIPVLEAMACGTPVVASSGNSLEEVGAHAVLYVDPLCSDEISFQIERLLVDDVLRKKQIEKGYERVREFSWEKCAKKTFEFLT